MDASEPLSDQHVIGVDVGGTKILGLVLDGDGRILAKVKRPTQAARGPERVLERIASVIGDLLERAGLEPSAVRGLGMGIPGTVDPRSGFIDLAPNLNLRQFNIRDFVEDEFRIPTTIDNDVNLGAYAEHQFGAGRGKHHLLGVFIGTGIGAGLILDGRLYAGATSAAGEIGHLCLDPDGPRCDCGFQGCFEAIASRAAIVRDIAAAVVAGETCTLGREPDGSLSTRAGALREAYDQGDPLVRRVIDRAIRWTGAALGSAANLLNPELIVLGGGMATAFGEIYLRPVREAVQRRVYEASMAQVEVALARLGDNAGALGAAWIARERLRTSGSL